MASKITNMNMIGRIIGVGLAAILMVGPFDARAKECEAAYEKMSRVCSRYDGDNNPLNLTHLATAESKSRSLELMQTKLGSLKSQCESAQSSCLEICDAQLERDLIQPEGGDVVGALKWQSECRQGEPAQHLAVIKERIKLANGMFLDVKRSQVKKPYRPTLADLYGPAANEPAAEGESPN